MPLPPIDLLLKNIDILIETIESMRPLSSGERKELQKSLRVMEVYNSNAIEGNTLTLGETKLVIEDGITIGGKSIREMHEAANLANAIERFLYSGNQAITEDIIRELHAGIMRNIDDENAGKYRKIQVYISGDEVKPPESKKVPELMHDLIKRYAREKNTLHPVILSACFHYDFVKIHPFVDGNGRSARLLANMILMGAGYPMIILPVVRRMEYMSSLHSLTGNRDRFTHLYADIVHENLKDFIRMIGE